tara:strand:+ start:165 stop:608 length:444 start_codon:yes stop_codon:yes gene_type:complete
MKKILIALLALIIINCGGGTPQEAQVVNIGSLGSEMKYDIEEFTVKAGSKVKIVLKNNTPLEFQAEMQHNIVIFKDESAAPEIIKLAEDYFGGDAPDDNRILAKSILIDKQEETTVEFDAPKKAGKYLYVCTYIAHAGSMRGYMIVE